MDASDVIKQLRDKTVYNNLYVTVSKAKSNTSKNTYTFPDYETKNEYYKGQYLSSIKSVTTG